MKNIKLILLLFLLCKVVYAQKICTYHYVLNERISSIDSVPLLGMESEFATKREYYNDSLFSETRLFTGRNAKSILFKIEKGIWCYKTKNNWNLFYDFNTKKGGYISLFKLKNKIQFKKVVIIRNEILHEIVLEPVSVSTSHKLHYYFSPSKGIVIIKTSSGTILLRKESFGKPLTDAESENL